MDKEEIKKYFKNKYSNINSQNSNIVNVSTRSNKRYVFWLTPNKTRLNADLYIILNNNKEKIAHLLKISSFELNVSMFKQRDLNRFHIEFYIDDNNFEDIVGENKISFFKYKIDEFKY